MDIKKYNVEIIKSTELINLDGGKNILEWAAYGVGYLSAAFDEYADYTAEHELTGFYKQ